MPAAVVGRGGRVSGGPMTKMQLAVELYITTGEQQYWDFIVNNWDAVVASASNCAWYMTRIEKQMEGNKKYKKQCAAFRDALLKYRDQLDRQSAATPYGVPYSPSIWGAGWDIQSFGYRHFFLAKAYPDIFAPDQVLDALNFILGRHPGLNQASFAGGVGAHDRRLRLQPGRLDLCPGRHRVRHCVDPSRLPRAAGIPVPVAAGRICDGWRLLALYVPGPRGQGPA